MVGLSCCMGRQKGKWDQMIYEQFGDLEFRYRNREFWCRGWYVHAEGKRLCYTV